MKTCDRCARLGCYVMTAAALAVFMLNAGCKTAAGGAAAAGAGKSACHYAHVVEAAAAPKQPIQSTAVPGFCSAAFDAAACGPCRWSMAVANRCSSSESAPAQDLFCVCNQCLQDADCSGRAGGRCVAVRALATTVQLCTFPGERCHPDAACANGQECVLDATGALECRPAEPCGSAG